MFITSKAEIDKFHKRGHNSRENQQGKSLDLCYLGILLFFSIQFRYRMDQTIYIIGRKIQDIVYLTKMQANIGYPIIK